MKNAVLPFKHTLSMFCFRSLQKKEGAEIIEAIGFPILQPEEICIHFLSTTIYTKRLINMIIQ
jgi:hypothetical protein